MARRLQLGDVVREHEGRHFGTVVALFGHGTEATTVRVRWDSGCKTDFDHRDLTLMRKANEQGCSYSDVGGECVMPGSDCCKANEPPFEPDARIVWEDQ